MDVPDIQPDTNRHRRQDIGHVTDHFKTVSMNHT